MLNDLRITQRTLNRDGTLSISVQTNDDKLGSHRFGMVLDAKTYAKLPKREKKEPAIDALVKANITKQHSDWVKRKEYEKGKDDPDLKDMALNKNIL